MDDQTFKIYIYNLFAFIMTFSNIDAFLKILLTIVVIGYTCQKWYHMHVDRKEKKQNRNEEDN